MTDHPSGEEQLGARLLAHDQVQSTRSRGVAASDTRAWMDALIERELATETWLRAAAMYAWCAVFSCVLMSGLMFYVAGGDVELLAKAGKAAMYTFEALAAVALLLALILSSASLYRMRSVSAARIERRLAALEALLERKVS